MTPTHRRPFKETHHIRVRGHARRHGRLSHPAMQSLLKRSEIRLASTRALTEARNSGALIPPEERREIRRWFDRRAKGAQEPFEELKPLFPREEDYKRVRGLYFRFLQEILRGRKTA